MTSLPKKQIREYMRVPLITLEPDMTLAYAMKTFLQRRIHGAPVIENGALVGILTMTDIVSALDRELPTTSLVSEVMVTRVITMPADMRLYEVIKQFKEEDVGRVIVTEEGKPVGILTHSDIIQVFPSL